MWSVEQRFIHLVNSVVPTFAQSVIQAVSSLRQTERAGEQVAKDGNTTLLDQYILRRRLLSPCLLNCEAVWG